MLRFPPAQFLSAPPHPCSLCCSDQLPASLESGSPIKLVCFHWKHYIHKSESGFVEVLLVWFSLGDCRGREEFKKKKGAGWWKSKIIMNFVVTSCRCYNQLCRLLHWKHFCERYVLENGKVTVGCGADCPPCSCSDGWKVRILSSVLISQGQLLIWNVVQLSSSWWNVKCVLSPHIRTPEMLVQADYVLSNPRCYSRLSWWCLSVNKMMILNTSLIIYEPRDED